MASGVNDVADSLPGEVVVLVPTGMLGAGIAAEHVRRGVARGARVIALDAGSTDSGPAYLAQAVSKMDRESVRRDLTVLMTEGRRAGIPILIGSCGTSGTDAGVDWTAEIAAEVARDLEITPKIALIYSEQTPGVIRARNAAGKIRPLPPAGPLVDARIDGCDHIVAVLGPEPYMAAIADGADIVLGGRTTDTAILAAVPLMRGAGAGPAWHAGKVAECGGQCTADPRAGGVLIRVGEAAFDVEPLDPANRCSPQTVSAHMLYETSDPFRLIEPGGVLDVSSAEYRQIAARVTRVSGSRWTPMPYTLKLEGAGGGAYQTIMIIGVEDPDVLANLDAFHDRMHAALTGRVRQIFGEEAGGFDISLRLYGWNGVSGRASRAAPTPAEVGILFVVTAATQDLANRMAKACNPYFFHFPLRPGIELPSYAFPFTPAEIPRGQVFEFLLNHVVEVDDANELARTRWIDLAADVTGIAAHG